MSDIEELKDLMHTFHCQGRAIEGIYQIMDELDILVLEYAGNDDIVSVRNKLKCCLTQLEYKW